jgi:hypothetical protein
MTSSKLNYTDHDGITREVRGCNLTVDNLGLHWIWSEQTESNLVYKTKGREDALLAALDSALYYIKLKDKHIADLQKIADLAYAFADSIKPDDNDD